VSISCRVTAGPSMAVIPGPQDAIFPSQKPDGSRRLTVTCPSQNEIASELRYL
jgi:hypothetical protein